MQRKMNPRMFAGFVVGILLIATTLLVAWDHAGPEAGGNDASAALGGPGETIEVSIRNFRFNPGEMRIKRGTRVVFVNYDDVEHNIIQSSDHRIGAGPASFESPILLGGQRWGKVFTEPGVYPIVCTVDGHQLMGMVGSIIVE